MRVTKILTLSTLIMLLCIWRVSSQEISKEEPTGTTSKPVVPDNSDLASKTFFAGDDISISEIHERTVPGNTAEIITSRELQTARVFTAEQLYNIRLQTLSEEKDIVGVGVTTLIVSAFGIMLSMYTQTTPVIAGFAYSQMQTAQVLTLVDAFLPDEYHQFSQAMSYSKLDFEFMDTTDIRMDLRRKGYINGIPFTGYTYVVPTRLPAGSFFVNYVYLWMFVGLLLIVHIGLIIVTCIPAVKQSDHGAWDFVRAIRKSFEFSVYFYLMVFTLPFSFILTLNEFSAEYWETDLLTFSFFVSVFFFTLLILIGLLPVLFLFSKNLGLGEEDEEENAWWKTFLKSIRAPFWNGIRDDKIARLFYTVVWAKYFIFAMFLILSDKPKVQIAFIIIASVLYFAYLVIVRPFNYLIQNIAAIANQGVTVFVTFLFIGFTGDSPSDEHGLAKTIGSFLGVSIVLTAALGFLFQGYLLHVKVSRGVMTTSTIKDTKETENRLGKSAIQKIESEEEMAGQNNLYINNDQEQNE